MKPSCKRSSDWYCSCKSSKFPLKRHNTRTQMSANGQAAIFIVEDDEGVALLERRALERRGFSVSKVTTGAEALEAIQRGSPDLVVMDYRLPDSTTGLDLLAKMKALGHDLPI